VPTQRAIDIRLRKRAPREISERIQLRVYNLIVRLYVHLTAHGGSVNVTAPPPRLDDYLSPSPRHGLPLSRFMILTTQLSDSTYTRTE